MKMRALFFILSFLLSGFAHGQMLPFPNSGTSSVASCTQADTFLARTSGLDTTHTNMYKGLICCLVTNSVWTKFNVLYQFATQDSTTALLNLVSTSYTGTAHGSPTFTADRGFTGVEGSTTVYVDTGFNPVSDTSNFTQNSAHISEWNVTSLQSGHTGVGSINAGQTANTYILAQFSDGAAYFRINVGINAGQSLPIGSSIGHFIANRDDSTSQEGYVNGAPFLGSPHGGGQASAALVNQNFYAMAYNFNGTAGGVGRQVAEVSAGSTLTPTDVANFYSCERTAMTAIGVP